MPRKRSGPSVLKDAAEFLSSLPSDDGLGWQVEDVRKRLIKLERLWGVCEQFLADNRVSCPEAILQMDHVLLNAPELIEAIGLVVGWAKPKS